MASRHLKNYLHSVFLGLLVFCLILTGCTLSQVQSDVDKVIADLPTILAMAESIITIVGALKTADPSITPAMVAKAQQVEMVAAADLNTVGDVLTSYRANLAAAPASALATISAASQAIEQNLSELEATFTNAGSKVQAAIAITVTGVNAFLLGVASLVPTAIAQLRGLTASRATLATLYVIPSPRALAQTYNAKMRPLVPTARVHTPWARAFGVPVLP